MKFGSLEAINLLWVVGLIVLFYLWCWGKRTALKERFIDKELLSEMGASIDIKKQKLKNILIIFALFMFVFALMRPRWGFHWRQIKRKGLDIIVAIDTSKSMLAEDVRPNRLRRSKLAVEDLIKRLKGDRIGLIAFAGEAFLQCPLTVDYNGFILALNDLDVETIPRGGTSISKAIKEAIKGFEGGLKKYKVLILITDGEDHEGDPIQAAKEAKKEGIKIYCIGIGTKEGELIPVTDESGRKVFLKDRAGNVVKSRLDESVLQKIALMTGGSYVRASGAEFGLELIYEKRLSKLERREIESRMKKLYEERFQIPLFLGFVLLMVEFLIPERRSI